MYKNPMYKNPMYKKIELVVYATAEKFTGINVLHVALACNTRRFWSDFVSAGNPIGDCFKCVNRRRIRGKDAFEPFEHKNNSKFNGN